MNAGKLMMESGQWKVNDGERMMIKYGDWMMESR